MSEFVMYKNKPLVKCGNIYYYGEPKEPFIAMLQVLKEEQVDGIELPDKILINILSTDESLPLAKRMVKRAEKNGLYSALSIASIWLDRQISETLSK